MNTRVVKLNDRGSYNLYAVGDVHVGAKACDKKAFRRTIEDIRKDKRAVVILMGDLLDAIVAGDKRFNAYELDDELPKFKDQVDWIVASLKPIKDKIIGVIEGNHEYTIRKKIGYDFTEWIADELDANYLHQSSMVLLETPWKTYRILAMHGIGGGATIGGQLNKIKRMMQNFETAPDIVLCGHFHRLDCITVSLMDDKLSVKPRHVGFTGCYYRTYVEGFPNYASDKWYAPSLIGCLRFTLTPESVKPRQLTYLE